MVPVDTPLRLRRSTRRRCVCGVPDARSVCAALALLSLAAAAGSVDEAASIHELAIAPLHNALDTHGIFYFAWVIPALLVVVVLGLAYVRFLGNLPREVRTLFICAAGTYVIGALGGDLVGGRWYEAHGGDNLTYALMTQIEENLETAGISLGIVAVLTYFIRIMPSGSISGGSVT